MLKDDLVLWVDPQKIDHHVRSKRPNNIKVKEFIRDLKSIPKIAKLIERPVLRLTNALESFVIEDTAYEDLQHFSSVIKYKKVSDFVKNRNNFRNSIWYSDLLLSLQEKGYANHKKIYMYSESEIDHFITSYVLGLINSLEQDGYIGGKGREFGTALIGKDGSIHKSASGNHRFYFSRVLGIKPVPLVISGVHEDWYLNNVGFGLHPRRLKQQLRAIGQTNS